MIVHYVTIMLFVFNDFEISSSISFYIESKGNFILEDNFS